MRNYKLVAVGIIGMFTGAIMFCEFNLKSMVLGLIFIAVSVFLIYKESKKQPAPKKRKIRYVYSINSDVYHKPTCKSVYKMARENIIRSDAAAEDLRRIGMRPCPKCRPK